MDHGATPAKLRLRRIVGLPDGNGQPLNVARIVLTAVLTAVSGLAGVEAAKAGARRAADVLSATVEVYDLPTVVIGPWGAPDREGRRERQRQLGLERRTQAVEEAVKALRAVDPDDAKTIAEFARDLRNDKAKKRRGNP